VIDTDTEFGARVARHLREDVVVWLTTVTAGGAPLPRPVWFIWDGAETVRIYSLPGARARNIERNPQVTLNFDGNGQGGDIVVLSGTAAIDASAPPAAQDAGFVTKYADQIPRIGMTPESFSERYSMPVRITINAVNGH
jgi:PPOX class probable F420-dependent enzyme